MDKIDVLAMRYLPNTKIPCKYLVAELKKDAADNATIDQVLKYGSALSMLMVIMRRSRLALLQRSIPRILQPITVRLFSGIIPWVAIPSEINNGIV